MKITYTRKESGYDQIDVYPTEEKANEYLEKCKEACEISAREAKKINNNCLYHYKDSQGFWCYTIWKTRAAIKAATTERKYIVEYGLPSGPFNYLKIFDTLKEAIEFTKHQNYCKVVSQEYSDLSFGKRKVVFESPLPKNKKIVIFEGIDSCNRPVFIEKQGSVRWGAVSKLFAEGSKESKVLRTVTERDLSYFGTEFDCEPQSSTPGENLIIERQEKETVLN